MKKMMLMFCGWLLLVLAVMGIVLPVLPTTPFVIAAAACFSIGDPKMYQRLESSKVFGPYLEGWRTKQGISASRKASAIAILWILMTLSILLTQKLWLTVLLIFIGIGVTTHLLLMKTKK
ncbi:DUF454 domain-containing protein [Anoxybacterium hadale]|uniref:DUF454 domain-containing protein n=1 Tax=Anoxybacterium hadale TaxID=3408580 RepID=A0ACD1A986_9FIRM|nr:DUF454 domain-containing protein [Clostridiales bacterium]